MRKLVAALAVLSSLVLACGPDAADGSAAAPAAPASIVYCNTKGPAYYCYAGQTPLYYYLAPVGGGAAACAAAVAAKQCTAKADGTCYFTSFVPLGCTPR